MTVQDNRRPSYRALVEALAGEFSSIELSGLAEAIEAGRTDEQIGLTARQLTAIDIILDAITEVTDRP